MYRHGGTPYYYIEKIGCPLVVGFLFSSGSFGLFAVTFRFGDQYLVRQFELACLRVDVQQLHFDVVAFFESGFFYRFEAFPVDFGDVEQTVFAWQEFNECTVRHDGTDLSFVDFSYLGNGYNSLDHPNGVIDALLVGAGDFDLAYVVFFFDGDGSTCLFLHTLNDLSWLAAELSPECRMTDRPP